MSFTNEQGKTNKIAVLIPCFNEAGTIAKVVREYRSALPEAVIMVCDNHSSDGTGEIAQAAGASVITISWSNSIVSSRGFSTLSCA